MFPSRKDLDPIDIPQLLPFLTLADVAPEPFCFIYRLVGTAAAAILKRDLTGAPVGDGETGEEREHLLAGFRQVRGAGVVLRHRVRVREEGNEQSLIDHLMMPLGEKGDVSKVLSMIVQYRSEAGCLRG